MHILIFGMLLCMRAVHGQRRKEGRKEGLLPPALIPAACPAQSCAGPWLLACDAKARGYYYSLPAYGISGVITF